MSLKYSALCAELVGTGYLPIDSVGADTPLFLLSHSRCELHCCSVFDTSIFRKRPVALVLGSGQICEQHVFFNRIPNGIPVFH